MLFIEHFFKWCFATLFALVVTVFIGGIPFTISMIFIDPPRKTSTRTIEASNLRQIGQASLIFAIDHRDHLPDATDLPDYARQLAIGGGLNDTSIWLPYGTDLPENARSVLAEIPGQPREQQPINPAFSRLPHLFTVPLNGITSHMPPTTPIAWTRGLDLETGRWRSDSPYRGEGGHIAFLGGNVQFYRTLQNAAGGELVARDGHLTHRIRDTLPAGTRISADSGMVPAKPTFAERLQKLLRDVPAAMRTIINWAWPLWMLALFVKLTFVIIRTWGVPIARVRVESRPRWLILTPLLLLALSILFQV